MLIFFLPSRVPDKHFAPFVVAMCIVCSLKKYIIKTTSLLKSTLGEKILRWFLKASLGYIINLLSSHIWYVYGMSKVIFVHWNLFLYFFSYQHLMLWKYLENRTVHYLSFLLLQKHQRNAKRTKITSEIVRWLLILCMQNIMNYINWSHTLII